MTEMETTPAAEPVAETPAEASPMADVAPADAKEEKAAEEPVVARAAAPSASYNVRELLELERKIYEESIEKQIRRHNALLGGTLDEYIAQCQPIAREREREMDVAMVRMLLNKQNAADLLAFELKQAEDVFQTQRQTLKRRLVEAAERKRARIVERSEQIEKGDSSASQDKAAVCKNEGGDEIKGPPADEPILLADGKLDAEALEKVLDSSSVANLAAFNLDHLEHNLPPASAIVSDVVEEMERQRAYQKEVTDPDTVCGVVVDADAGKVWIGLMDVFTVLDHVVLWSSLSDEEFYGQIVRVSKERIELMLVCGSHVQVSVEQLRKQLCTLQLQGTPHSALTLSIEERVLRTPKRKRNRRKHTIGMRQKI